MQSCSWRCKLVHINKCVTYIQHILLDYGVHDDCHKHVEEDGGQVLDAVVEVVHCCLIWA